MNFIFLLFMEVWMQWSLCQVNVTYFVRDPLRSYLHEHQKNEIYFLTQTIKILDPIYIRSELKCMN